MKIIYFPNFVHTTMLAKFKLIVIEKKEGGKGYRENFFPLASFHGVLGSYNG